MPYVFKDSYGDGVLPLNNGLARWNTEILAGIARYFFNKPEKNTHIHAKIDLETLEEENLDCDCIITHLPYHTHETDVYRKGLEHIIRIKQRHPEIPIIIYTGADDISVPDEKLKSIGIQHIIRKEKIGEDIQKLNETLEKILR